MLNYLSPSTLNQQYNDLKVTQAAGAMEYTKLHNNSDEPDDYTSEPDQNHGEMVLERQKNQLKPPSMYRVLMMDDDFTPMDFVVEVLQTFFSLNQDQATQIMLKVHNEGKAICGIFTKDVAETKASMVLDHARENQHPLYCKAEADDS